MDIKTLGIAIAAGVASVFAVYSATHAGVVAVPLFMLGALPVYIAALAWGTNAGIAASISAIIAAAVMISPQAAVIAGLLYTIPASLIGHQANLAQQSETGAMDWYPLSRLLFNLSTMIALGLLAVGYALGYQSDVLLPDLSASLKLMFTEYPPAQPMTDADIDKLAENMFRILPFMFAGIWLIAHVTNLQLAAIICRYSNKMPRPKDDIPASANMPKFGLPILVGSLVAIMLFDGDLYLAASVIAGVFLVAFSLVGLAAMHFRARSNPGGLVFLIISYVIIVIFYLPLFFFAIGGIARCLNQSTNTPPQAGANQS